ncbi:MAG: hypothetical protein M0C28_47480 [Candidatus Moduliflexus flocculans]|nr:hypothetical protein [Candidatus Moduliflexus flocculans]
MREQRSKKDEYQKALTAFGQAVKEFQKGEFEKAAASFQDFIEKFPAERGDRRPGPDLSSPSPRRNRRRRPSRSRASRTTSARASSRSTRGDYPGAVKVLEKALEFKENEGLVHYLLADAHCPDGPVRRRARPAQEGHPEGQDLRRPRPERARLRAALGRQEVQAHHQAGMNRKTVVLFLGGEGRGLPAGPRTAARRLRPRGRGSRRRPGSRPGPLRSRRAGRAGARSSRPSGPQGPVFLLGRRRPTGTGAPRRARSPAPWPVPSSKDIPTATSWPSRPTRPLVRDRDAQGPAPGPRRQAGSPLTFLAAAGGAGLADILVLRSADVFPLLTALAAAGPRPASTSWPCA